MESVRSLYAFGARLIPPDEGDRGDIRSGCGCTRQVYIPTNRCMVMLLPICTNYVDFSLESTLHTYSQRKRTIRGQNVYADKLATGKW